MQSRKLSLIEAVTNTAVGFGVSLASQLAIFSAYGVVLPLTDNVLITCWFTLISIARGYLLRRAFNARGRNSIPGALPLPGRMPPPHWITPDGEIWAPPRRNPTEPPLDWRALRADLRERFGRESA